MSDKARAAASDARRGYENVKGDVNSSMASARERAEDLEYDTRRRAEEVKQDVRSTVGFFHSRAQVTRLHSSVAMEN